MNDYSMDSDDEMLAPRGAVSGGDEFDLDESTLEQMRENERRIIAQQQAAAAKANSQSNSQSQSSQLAITQSSNQSDSSANTLTNNSGISSHQPSSDLTPAQVASATRTVVGVAFEPSTVPGELIKVKLTVFDRFIPHLVESLDHPANQSTEADDSAMIEDSDSDSDSDSDVEFSRDLRLTGDRDADAATLKALMDESSDESDVEFVQPKRKGNDMSDDDDEEGGTSGPLRTRNEISVNELPPPPPFTVSPADQLASCGTFMSMVDGFLIVEAELNSKALDVGSAVCLIDRTAVGRVEEVFGPVDQPMYGIRPIETFTQSNIKPSSGTTMYFVSSLSSFVLADTKPGSDASNVHDEEVDPEEAEYSDDEKEQQAKREIKQAKAAKKKGMQPSAQSTAQSSNQQNAFKAQSNKNRSFPRPPPPPRQTNNASFQPMPFPTQQPFTPYAAPQAFNPYQQPGFSQQQFYQQPGFAPQFFTPNQYQMPFPGQQQPPFAFPPQQQPQQSPAAQPQQPSSAIAPPPGIRQPKH